MFEGLGNRLTGIFDGLRGRGALSEDDVKKAMREIRVALLEADVALPVAKAFIDRVRDKAVGQEVVRSVTPGQMVVKIVSDELVRMLGSEASELKLIGEPPLVYLMVGLQGAGKTTTTGKLGKRLKERERKKVLMASLDTRRPAAQEQLAVLGQQTGVDTLPIVPGENPVAITKRAQTVARMQGYDVLILDTAGRLSIDLELMEEVRSVRAVCKPVETLLVVDAMTGQDAVQTGKAFHEALDLTGIVLTRIDGDARGGAALSMREVTGCPIKLIGEGEGMDALDVFHPERIANRILGMGDVVSLVEKAAEHFEEAEAEKIAKRLQKGQFDLNDLASQLKQMQSMGGMGALMKMLPGGAKMQAAMKGANIDDSLIKRQLAIISSMTPNERSKPELLKASRKLRVASGSGTSVQDVNKLLKQYNDAAKMMKRMKKMGKKGGGFPGMGGGGMPPGFGGGGGGMPPGFGGGGGFPGLGGR